ncbi:hypothetical protein L1987_66017 [Smallanthus sonchifolius]|uniref:Uncharacterized protein n=1 Tax=Smallanthus sonchifolius TaxID=185202 RepID=A0ACB9BW68_9ASTR|nr:hypothetical protein L1987_66017 [Smallanthus sonchifolius]
MEILVANLIRPLLLSSTTRAISLTQFPSIAEVSRSAFRLLFFNNGDPQLGSDNSPPLPVPSASPPTASPPSLPPPSDLRGTE